MIWQTKYIKIILIKPKIHLTRRSARLIYYKKTFATNLNVPISNPGNDTIREFIQHFHRIFRLKIVAIVGQATLKSTD